MTVTALPGLFFFVAAAAAFFRTLTSR